MVRKGNANPQYLSSHRPQSITGKTTMQVQPTIRSVILICLTSIPILANSRLLIVVGTSAAATKITGVTSQVGLIMELALKTLIAKIAAIVTTVVSVSKDVSSRLNLLPKNGADPTAGSGLAILNFLDG